MNQFEEYQRKQIAELRPVTKEDIEEYNEFGFVGTGTINLHVSISDSDLDNGSPKDGDMIARNPKNHNDQWLVAKQYFEDNFELKK